MSDVQCLLRFTAEEILKRVPKGIQVRLLESAEQLAENPFPKDVKRIAGERFKAYRIRVGDYRIQYAVDYNRRELLIYKIEKRARAY